MYRLLSCMNRRTIQTIQKEPLSGAMRQTTVPYIYFVPDTPPPHVSAASMATGNRFNIFSSVSILLLLLLPAHLNSSPSAHCDLPRAARNTQSLHPAVVEASFFKSRSHRLSAMLDRPLVRGFLESAAGEWVLILSFVFGGCCS
jgi:hypothetical protein